MNWAGRRIQRRTALPPEDRSHPRSSAIFARAVGADDDSNHCARQYHCSPEGHLNGYTRDPRDEAGLFIKVGPDRYRPGGINGIDHAHRMDAADIQAGQSLKASNRLIGGMPVMIITTARRRDRRLGHRIRPEDPSVHPRKRPMNFLSAAAALETRMDLSCSKCGKQFPVNSPAPCAVSVFVAFHQNPALPSLPLQEAELRPEPHGDRRRRLRTGVSQFELPGTPFRLAQHRRNRQLVAGNRRSPFRKRRDRRDR